MAFYPIVQKTQKQSLSADHRRLPDFYMEDFSILGFQVADCHSALQLLEKHAFLLKKRHGMAEVAIASPKMMQDVVEMLEHAGISCEIADIVDGIYQG